MIPVIGIVHYKDPIVTENCLRTIPDDIYYEMVIVDNTDEANAPAHVKPDARMIRFRGNMGVAHAWNTIIKATPHARWWMLCNNDIEFIRKDFERMETAMMANDIVKMGGFEAFGIHRRVVKEVGWFDESFHPAYCEDNDYQHRVEQTDLKHHWMHGPFKHLGSNTIRSDPALRERNNETYPSNVRYYLSKWGGEMGREIYTTPFNKGEQWPVTPDIDRLAQLAWRPAQE